MRLWDADGRYPQVTPSYCRDVCGAERCPKCPGPKLLDSALPAVAAYRAVDTQWAHGGIGQPTGLRYGDVLPALRLLHRSWVKAGADAPAFDALFEQVQVIESALLEAWAELAEKRSAQQGRE